MSFDTPNGTRGARQPRGGRVMRWFNNWTMNRVRKGGKMIGGSDALVLTTVGRKSGIERSTPVGYFPGDDGGWIIVASAAGAAKNPAWYYNLAAHPDQVRIETGGHTISVVAEQLHGAQRDRAWAKISAASPRFAQYQDKTDRELPVILLTPHAPTM